MDVGTFCAQSQVLVVAGKGGVGKTTMSAALARWRPTPAGRSWSWSWRASPGSPRPSAPSEDLGYEEVTLAHVGAGPAAHPRRRADRVSRGPRPAAGLAAAGSLGRPRRGRHRHPGHPRRAGPGQGQAARAGRAADLIIVDAPATGHAITFLTSASGLVDAARGGPLRTQAQEVVELLSDPTRCRVVLVTLPEELPVSETVESAYTLEDKAGRAARPGDRQRMRPRDPPAWTRPAAEVAAAAGVHSTRITSTPSKRARRFRLARHAVSTEQIDAARAASCPCPSCSSRPSARAVIGPAETQTAGRRPGPRPSHALGRGGGTRERGRTAAVPPGRPERTVIVCCGSGGVGKTTVSATFALAAARCWPPLLRGHRRPGTAAGRRARRELAAQHADRGRGRLAGPPLRAHARRQGDLRRTGPPLRPLTRAGRVDPVQPHLPEPGRIALGTQEYMAMEKLYELVGSGRVRRGRGRHPTRRATRSTCSTRPRASPGSSRTGSSAPSSCRRGSDSER